jgi:diacylglycerol kinase (ATP)
MKALIIHNPAAGGGKNRDALIRKLKDALRAEVRFTKRKGDARRLARNAMTKGFDYIIAGGGDGTLNEVINGVAAEPARVRLGVLPLGTGNDFARTLNLPSSVEENIDILLSRQTKAIDLVRMQSDRIRYFVNVSAGGFSGMVDEKLTLAIKRTWGPLAYIRSAAAAFPELHGYRTKIVIDDTERLSIDLCNVIVGNGRYVAHGLPVAPKANPSDGLLDIILISQRPRTEMVLLAAQILLGKHLCSDAVVFRRARKISISSRPGMCFNTDGELVGKNPAVFEVIRRALHFVVGKR